MQVSGGSCTDIFAPGHTLVERVLVLVQEAAAFIGHRPRVVQYWELSRRARVGAEVGVAAQRLLQCVLRCDGRKTEQACTQRCCKARACAAPPAVYVALWWAKDRAGVRAEVLQGACLRSTSCSVCRVVMSERPSRRARRGAARRVPAQHLLQCAKRCEGQGTAQAWLHWRWSARCCTAPPATWGKRCTSACSSCCLHHPASPLPAPPNTTTNHKNLRPIPPAEPLTLSVSTNVISVLLGNRHCASSTARTPRPLQHSWHLCGLWLGRIAWTGGACLKWRGGMDPWHGRAWCDEGAVIVSSRWGLSKHALSQHRGAHGLAARVGASVAMPWQTPLPTPPHPHPRPHACTPTGTGLLAWQEFLDRHEHPLYDYNYWWVPWHPSIDAPMMSTLPPFHWWNCVPGTSEPSTHLGGACSMTSTHSWLSTNSTLVQSMPSDSYSCGGGAGPGWWAYWMVGSREVGPNTSKNPWFGPSMPSDLYSCRVGVGPGWWAHWYQHMGEDVPPRRHLWPPCGAGPAGFGTRPVKGLALSPPLPLQVLCQGKRLPLLWCLCSCPGQCACIWGGFRN